MFEDEGNMGCAGDVVDAASTIKLLFRGGVLLTDEMQAVVEVAVEQLLRVRFRALRNTSSTPMGTNGSDSPTHFSLSKLLSTVATSSPTKGDSATCDATDTDHAWKPSHRPNLRPIASSIAGPT